MKKKIALIALLVMLLSSIGYGTYAYTTVNGRAENVITTSGVHIELVETVDDKGTPFPSGGIDGVVPGTVQTKNVWVQNTGPQTAWVRVKVDVSIQLAEGVTGTVDTSLVRPDFNTEDWTEKDGYYYYNEPLVAREKTAHLFTQVEFAPEMGNLYQGSKAFVKVHAEATQTKNNGETVWEALGWPESK